MLTTHVSIEPLRGDFGAAIVNRDLRSILDLDVTQTRDLLASKGVVLFRNFDTTLEHMTEFSRKYGEVFLPYRGGVVSRKLVNEDDTVFYAAAGSAPGELISFHGEQYYQKEKPDTLWFYCKTPAAEGGETTVCDGVEVFQSLSQRAKTLFESQPMRLERHLSKANWTRVFGVTEAHELFSFFDRQAFEYSLDPTDESVRWEHVFSAVIQTRHTKQKAFVNNLIGIMCYGASLHPGQTPGQSIYVRFVDGTEIPRDLLDEVRDVADRVAYYIKWNPRDMGIVDNTRCMHGRAPYTDLRREIISRMSMAHA